ncbi:MULTISPECIES: hypothetical protein [unclassified Microcoleus]|uniref:hypothetical protein n=1 Tax=unclassified Microcoleus TaxID=2642155 RepID=UPI002FD6777F
MAVVREVKHSRKRKTGIASWSQPLEKLWNSMKFLWQQLDKRDELIESYRQALAAYAEARELERC